MPKTRTIKPRYTKLDQRKAQLAMHQQTVLGAATKKRDPYPTGRNGTLENVIKHLNKMHGSNL